MFKDWFDGGGFGQSGSTFKGGGILSELANMIAKPVGYSPNAPAQSQRPQGRPQNRHASQPAPASAPPPPQQPYQNPYGMVRFGPGGEIIREGTTMQPSPSQMMEPPPMLQQFETALQGYMAELDAETDPARREILQRAIDMIRKHGGQQTQ